MVFSRIVEIISSATNRPVRKSSSIPYMSSGLLPPTGYGHGFGFSGTGQKANLRLSSSLQDLTAYRRVDLEDVEQSSGTNTIFSKQPHPFLKENGASSFSKERASQGAPFKQRKWTRVFMVFLGLLLFSFLMFTLFNFMHSIWFGGGSKFFVVLDCGSTGTRIYIYQASVNNNKDENLPIVLRSYSEGFHRKTKGQSWRAYDRMETEPGLDKLVHNASGLKAAIKPLLRWAEKQIPKKSHKTTSLFVYATAGVRRLPSSDSEWVLNHLWSILRNSSFQCKKEWVKTISGMEEAYYGWIALNYQNGILGTIPKKATFGALDLGGSSLQVTFETVKPVHKDTNLHLSIGAVGHHLSAYSLSGYGLNDAFDKSVVHLLKGLSKLNHKVLAGESVEIRHPCLHSGYKEKYACSHCAAVFQESRSPRNEVKKLSKGGKAGTPVWLIGAPNWDECSSLAKIAVNLSEWSDLSPGIDCDVQPCALSEDLPHPYGQFYAMSGFFVVYRFFNLTSEATLDDVLDKGREFCDKSWDVAYKSVPPQPFIEQYCFRAPYIVSLLREGLHIADNRITIGSGSITWTLGVALVEAGKAFPTRLDLHKYELFQLKINPIILLAIFLISSVLAVYALSHISNWLPRIFRRPYIPLFRHSSMPTTAVLNISSPFRFPRWSPLSSVEGRAKTPLSPTTAEQERSFSMRNWLQGSNVQMADTSLYPAAGSVSHSISSGSLGQIQLENDGMGSFWTPHRGQTRLQSRRSQSREDLNTSLAESHLVKV
ncbi:Probable apyrase 7, variant 2 [Dionaea muscipula]